MWRVRLLALVAVLGLSACNTVISTKPLFFAADTKGGPHLRDGLWLTQQRSDAPCEGDLTGPVESWPKCFDSFVVRGDAILDVDRDATPPKTETLPFVLAAGDPPIWQLPVPRQEDGAEVAFVFFGVEAVKTDDQGRITEYRIWSAMCGPPPPKADGKERGTHDPLPGMKMDPQGVNCEPEDAEAVRRSVKASRAWDDAAVPGARWVRDGER
jgi:hypothetical protein